MDEYADDRLEEIVEMRELEATDQQKRIAELERQIKAGQEEHIKAFGRRLERCIRDARELGRDNLADALQTAVDRYF